MSSNPFPNLERMCRLCLQEDITPVYPIFGSSCKDTNLAMRINSVCALEIHGSVKGMPEIICNECRYQLEKCHYFRKRSQIADNKLKKHLRLLAAGKKSKVFLTNEDDDEYDDEAEFEDSLEIIRTHEIEKARKASEETEAKLQQARKELVITLRQSCVDQAKSELHDEVREAVKAELKDECIAKAKDELREEMNDRLRKEEIVRILSDLECFLNEKRSLHHLGNGDETLSSKSDVAITPSNVRCPNSFTPSDAHIFNYSESTITNDNFTSESQIEETPTKSKENNADMNTFFIIEEMEHQNDEHEFDECNTVHNEALDRDEDADIGSDMESDHEDPNDVTIYASDPLQHETKPIPNFHNTSYKIGDNGEIHVYQESKIPCESAANEINENDDNNQVMLFDLETNEDNSMDLMEYKMIPSNIGTATKNQSSTKVNKIINSSVTSVDNSKSECDHNVIGFVKPFSRSDTIKSFQCNECPIEFSTEKSLVRHLKIHEKIKATGVDHQCPVCKIMVSTRWALNRHMLTHSNIKPFTCDQCGKSFSQREVLRRHVETHMTEKRHKCTECSASFVQRINLNLHIKHRHSNEIISPQHKCHLCEKSFLHASGLSRHLLSHSGFSFQCSDCLRVFNDRSAIKRHINTVHNKPSDQGKSKIIEKSKDT